MTGGRLDGLVAVVAGAGQTPGDTIGNGRAIATTFAREGADVLCVDRLADRADETATSIRETIDDGRAVAFADRRRRLLGTVREAVDTEHLRALASERRRDRPAIADRVARRLAGTDHDRYETIEPPLSHR